MQQLRRSVMELYLSDHPEDCDGCARGNCEIQALAARVDAAEVRYGRPRPRDVAQRRPVDLSNPYFAFDPAACIVCSRCVRACSDIQGTFALTVEGRGLDSAISAGGTDFLSSECVSCGACVQACPTVRARRRSRSSSSACRPARVETTCAYCGVGCSFRAEVQGDGDDSRVVRMVPSQGRRRQRGPQLRQGPLRLRVRRAPGPAAAPDGARLHRRRVAVVSWEEAIAKVATGFQALQAEHGVGAIGGISSSRCTNEEVYVVQKMVRAAFGNNNIDTCARVCHSPTGYGLKQTFGTSAGTQDFSSVEKADVILLIGANPTDAHPVFASRMKRRLRAGCPADRGRPAPDRPGAQSARRGRPPPASAARLQRRVRQRDGARHRDRGPARRGVPARALRERRRLPRVHRRRRTTPRRRRPRRPASPPDAAARGGPALRRRAATARSTTASG